jgi:hypothetical protein
VIATARAPRVGHGGWLRAESPQRSQRVDVPLGLRRAGTDRRDAERKARSSRTGIGHPGALLEGLARDLKRSRYAAGPWFAVRGEDDLGVDRVESVERGERNLTIVV